MKGADRWGPVVSERSNKKKGGVKELGRRGWLACCADCAGWVSG
jgi:hypothetical protein